MSRKIVRAVSATLFALKQSRRRSLSRGRASRIEFLEGRQYLSDSPWIEDATPANTGYFSVYENYSWVTSNPSPHSGTASLKADNVGGGVAFYNMAPRKIGAGDKIVAYIYIDPSDPPAELELMFSSRYDNAHRAYFGSNELGSLGGVEGTASLKRIGDVPTAAGWNRLEIPAEAVGLADQYVDGLQLWHVDGPVAWDSIAIDALNVSAGPMTVNASPVSQSFTFDESPAGTPGVNDLTLENLSNNTTIDRSLLSTSYNPATKTGTLTWPGVNSGSGKLTDGNYEVTLSSTALATAGGKHLGGDTSIDTYWLDADFNRDRSVDTVDYAIFFANNGTVGKTFAQGDANLDGAVDSADYFILSSAYGRSLAEPPTTSRLLKVTNQHTDSLDLYWSRNADPAPDGYRVYRSTDGTNFTQIAELADNSYEMAYTATGLEDGTKYWFRVRPYTVAAGNGLSFTKAWGVTQLPAVSNLAINDIGATTAAVRWDTNSANESGFRILVSANGGPFQVWDTIAGNHAFDVNSYFLEGLSPSTQYAVEVIAISESQQSAPSASVSFATAAGIAPVSPSALYFEVPGLNDIALRWTDGGTDETSFIVQRSTDSTHWQNAEEVPANQTFCVLPYNSLDSSFVYRVLSANKYGMTPSSTVSLAPRAPVPTNLQATFTGQSSVHLSWDYASNTDGQFELQSATALGQPWTVVTLLPGTLRAYDLQATSSCVFRIRVFKAGVIPTLPNDTITEQTLGGPFVSVSTTIPFLAERRSRSDNSSVSGSVRFTRSGPTTSSLICYFTVSGTAKSRQDFTISYAPGNFTFPAGQTTVDLALNPILDNNYEGVESISLDVATDPTGQSVYSIGSHPRATAYIKDYANDPGITIGTNLRVAPQANGGTGASDFSAPAVAIFAPPRGSTNRVPGRMTFNLGSGDSADVSGQISQGVRISSPGFKIRSVNGGLTLESNAAQQTSSLEIIFDKPILSAVVYAGNASAPLKITQYLKSQVVAEGSATGTSSQPSAFSVGGSTTGIDRIVITSMTTRHLYVEGEDTWTNLNPLTPTTISLAFSAYWAPMTSLSDAPSIARVNSDWDEHHQDDSPDDANTTAMIKAPSAYGAYDDELASFQIDQLPAGAIVSKLELQLSNPNAVRLFTDDGSLVYDASQAASALKATPDGGNYLSGLYTHSKRIWFEALLPQTDFTFTLIYSDDQGQEVGRLEHHVLLLPRASGDLSVDSNNDGVIDSSDAVVEDSADTFGKLVPVSDGDSDQDTIPDWFDGFTDLAAATGDSDQATAAGNTLTPLELSLPSDVDPSSVVYSLRYDMSDPRWMFPKRMAVQDHAVGSLPGAGLLRIWTRNGSFQRTTATVPAGSPASNLSYLVISSGLSDYTASWSQLALASGGQPGDHKITLWVEAVKPSVAKGDQRITFEAHDAGNLAAVQAQDEVRVTTYRTVDSWRQQALKRAGLLGKTWDPSLGFDVNELNARAVYDYYASLYLSDPQHFQWAGLARLAGRAVYGALKTSQNSRHGHATEMSGFDLDNIKYLDTQFLTGMKDIFDDLAWQHEAFRTIGSDAIKALNLSGDRRVPPDVVGFWEQISSSDPTVVADGNRELAHREQFVVVQPTFKRIADHFTFPVSVVVNYYLSEATHSLFPGMHDFLDYALNVAHVDPYVTNVESRWKWFINDILPAWNSLTDAAKTALVKQGL